MARRIEWKGDGHRPGARIDAQYRGCRAMVDNNLTDADRSHNFNVTVWCGLYGDTPLSRAHTSTLEEAKRQAETLLRQRAKDWTAK